MAEYTNIGKTSEFTENHIRPVEVGDDKVAVVLSGGSTTPSATSAPTSASR